MNNFDGKQLLERLRLCAFAGLLAWSHPAASQDVSVSLGLGNNESFDLYVTNCGTVPITELTIDLGGPVWDLIRNSSTNPDVGSNNDGQQFSSTTITPNSPIDPGDTWSTSGDIDNGVPSVVDVTVAGVTFQLTQAQAGLFTGSAGLPVGQPGQPDPGDLCSGPDCQWFAASTIYVYTGDPLTLIWEPHPDDMNRRDRMFYFTEIRTLPLDNVVVSLQTQVAEEQFLWTPGLSGFYKARVQACDPDLIESGDIADMIPSEHCSDWADSMNDQNTPAQYPGWMIYAAVRPPTGGGIE